MKEDKDLKLEDVGILDLIPVDITAEVKAALNCTSAEFNKKYRAYRKAEKEFNAIYEPFKEKLLKLYEENLDMPNSVILGTTKVTYVAPSTRTSIDSKKLKEEEPELAKKYTKTTNVRATLRLDSPDVIKI